MTIAVDFDGTIVEHRYPKIGEEIPFATETLKILAQERHKLILWTVREGELLEEAIEWCRQRGVFFYSVNKDYPEEEKSHNGFSRKLKADLFIDDRNLGGLPDWGTIYQMIHEQKPYEPVLCETTFCFSMTRARVPSWPFSLARTGLRRPAPGLATTTTGAALNISAAPGAM